MIGRREELRNLNCRLADAVEGKGSAILISGAPGIGKTRFVDEFKRHAIASKTNMLAGAVTSGSAHPFHVFSKALEGVIGEPLFEEQEYTTFAEILAVNNAGMLLAKASSSAEAMDADIFAGMLSAVQDFVRDSFGRSGEGKAGLGRLEYGEMKILLEHSEHLFLTAVLSGQEHPDMRLTLKQALQKIEEGHGKTLEKWGGKMEELEPVQQEISKLAGAKFLVRRDLEGVRLEGERIRIADKVLECILRLAREKPQVILLEDIHWADESSLFIFNYLARNIRGEPVLLLATSRPGESPALDQTLERMRKEGIFQEMTLKKMERSDVSKIISSVYPGNDFPVEFVNALAERCGGTPLFVIEILKQMAMGGSISEKDGKYSLLNENFSIPETVEGVIQGRLDELSPETLAMVEYISCIGRDFSIESAMSIDTINDPGSALSGLERIGVINRQNDSAEFCHAMYQEVIYSTISQRWKGKHHRRIGEYFEEAYQGKLDDALYELARHFSQTGEYKKAFDYCLRAGEKAEGLFAAEQAIKFYGDALSALPKTGAPVETMGKETEILERLGDISAFIGKYDKSLEYYELAEKPAHEAEVKARMLRKLGKVLERKGDYDRSLELLAKAKEHLKDERSLEYGRICFDEGISYRRKSDYDKTISLTLKSMEIFESAGGEQKDIGKALRSIGVIHSLKGEFDEALNYEEKCLAIMNMINESHEIATSLHNIGILYWNKGELDKALEHHKRSLELFEKIGDKRGVASTFNNMGAVFIDKGELDRALEHYLSGLGIREKIGDKDGVANSLNNIGSVYYSKGELDRALEYYERSHQIHETLGNKHGVAILLDDIGSVYEDWGELGTALEYYQRSLQIRENLGEKRGVAFLLSSMGNVYRGMGELDKAQDHHERSLVLCREIKERKFSICNYRGLAEICLGHQNIRAALEHAGKAVDISVEIGVKREEGISRRVLGKVLLENKKLDMAGEEFGKAQGILEKIGDKKELAKLSYKQGILFKARNETEKAREYFEKALSEFRRMDIKAWADKTKKLLEES